MGDKEGFEKAAAKVRRRQENPDKFIGSTGRTKRVDRAQTYGYNKSVAGKDGAANSPSNGSSTESSSGSTAIKDEGTMRVSTEGRRNEKPLTAEQKADCIKIATEYGIPRSQIVFSEEMYTSYFSLGDRLYIGTDVYPSDNDNKANYRLSHRAAIAHELVGHRDAFLRGRSQNIDYLEEVQASLRASNASGLNDVDRILLVQDAIERLPKNVRLDDIIDKLFLEV